MNTPRDPDTIIRFLDAGHGDPERHLTLRVTNFLGGTDIRRGAAVYALAMQMSFRDAGSGHQRAILRAICEACLKAWAFDQDMPESDPCGKCGGIGTVGDTLESYEICPVCSGTGAA